MVVGFVELCSSPLPSGEARGLLLEVGRYLENQALAQGGAGESPACRGPRQGATCESASWAGSALPLGAPYQASIIL